MPRVDNYLHFLSRRSQRRKPSAIRKLTPLVSIPGMISLAGGLPHPSAFPFASLTTSLKDGTELPFSNEDLSKALQYSATPGLVPLLDLIKERTAKTHSPPYDDWAVTVGGGSQDLLSKTFDMLLNEGDDLFVEEPTYSGALAALAPLDCNLLGIATDGDGIIPSALKAAIEKNPKCKVLYTIPTGQNPSGATTTLSRRKEIYDLACAHNLIIMEDDPYWYLYLDEGQPASYFSMDVDQRVIRLESFSKILSSGMRIGWVSGPTPLVTQLQLDMQATCMHTSGISQTIVLSLLQQWGDEGWEKHVKEVQALYRKRRDFFLSLCDKHLTGLAKWHAPTAGMFVWFELIGIEDSSKLITEEAMEQKVLLVPGESFLIDPKGVSNCVRAAYSLAPEEDMEEGVKRFAALLRGAKK